MTPAPRAIEAPAMTPAPRAAPPAPAPQDLLDEDAAPERDDEEAFALQARRALTLAVPRMAAQAQYEIQRVLWVAAHAHDPAQERDVFEAAQSIRVREDASLYAPGVSRAEARRLNAEAMHAYWARRDIAQALDLQLKAFGANPYDPEIAGNLASLHLKPGWMQPETARQLALVALAARGPRHRAGRLEDWNTYAIASALSGRDADARNALFVGVALARNVDSSCRTALGALANYGERLREPVEAMIHRIHAQGRAYESPYCTWPPTRPGMRLRP
jgi:hypothetical protein